MAACTTWAPYAWATRSYAFRLNHLELLRRLPWGRLSGWSQCLPSSMTRESSCRAGSCSHALARICLLDGRAGTGPAHWEWFDQKLTRPFGQPLERNDATFLIEAINKRYAAKKSTIITSNKRYGHWHELITPPCSPWRSLAGSCSTPPPSTSTATATTPEPAATPAHQPDRGGRDD